MSTIPKYAAHPAADVLPNMSDTEYKALKDDIATNGLREPIVLYEGQILDGRHRYRACLELGNQARFLDHDGSDAVTFVISMNLRRRNLNPGQLALIAAKLADMKRGGDRIKLPKGDLTHAGAAKMLNVGKRSVDRASVLMNGVDAGRVIPELLVSVDKGEMRLARAEEVARLPKNQQLAAAAQKGRHKTIGGAPRRKPLARQVEDAERQLQESCDKMEQVAWRINNTAAKLAPQRYQQSIAVCERSRERLKMQIDWFEKARDRSSMPLGTDSPAA